MKKRHSMLLCLIFAVSLLQLSLPNTVIMVNASTGYIHVNAPALVGAGEIVNLDFSDVTFSGDNFFLMTSKDAEPRVSTGDSQYSPTFNVTDLQSSSIKNVEGYKIGNNWVNGSIPNGITGEYYIKAFDGNNSQVAVTDSFLNVDGTPPTIGVPTQNPPVESVLAGEKVTVSVNVTDADSQVENVGVLYKRVGEMIWNNLVMRLNDSSGLYETVIPGQAEGTWVIYIIIACDSVGNVAMQDDNGFYFSYPVIPEMFTTLMAVPMLIAATLLTTILYKKRKMQSKTP